MCLVVLCGAFPGIILADRGIPENQPYMVMAILVIHEALRSLRPKKLAWCHLRNFACLMLQCLPFVFPFPPARVCPFLSLLFYLSFFPVCTSLCLCLYLPYCFFAFLSAFVFFFVLLHLLFLFLSCQSLFASLGSLVVEYICLFFVFCLCFTPLAMRASLKSAKNCAFSCVSFLDFLLYIASLPDLNFFLSLPSWMCDFCFRFFISIFRHRVVIFILSIFSGYSMWSSRFLWRLVQRTARI